MKVYIIRHGEVPHNALKQYNNEDEDLTEKGIKQAEELKLKIKNINYDVVICSPLIRAKHTAEIINIEKKEIIIDNRLEERNPGNLSGQSLEVTNREEYWNYNTTIKYGTSENIKLFFDRVYNFLDELKQKVIQIKQIAEEKECYGTSALMDDYLMDYSKRIWMLNETLK